MIKKIQMGAVNTQIKYNYGNYDKKTKILYVYGQTNKKIKFPIGIKGIYFTTGDEGQGSMYNEPLDNLPSTLTYLFTGYRYNQSADMLPNSLITLEFGNNFNQSVDNLPKSLTQLQFGYNFNCSVDKLPNQITHLTFGWAFNKPVDSLPNLITHLTFGYNFNQSIDKLPKLITHLTFGVNFNQSIDKLPNLICLIFDPTFKNIDKIPDYIDNIEICDDKSIKTVYDDMIMPRRKLSGLIIDNIPPHIKIIKTDWYIAKFIKKIPWGCKLINIHSGEIIPNDKDN